MQKLEYEMTLKVSKSYYKNAPTTLENMKDTKCNQTLHYDLAS